MKCKKVEFTNVKQGQFFRWKRCLWQRSDVYDAQKLQGRDAGRIDYLNGNEKVTIVKIKILEE